MWVIWNLVSIHSETVLVSVQNRCTVCAKRPLAQKSFRTHLVVLLGDKAQVEARFGPFEDIANLEPREGHVLR
jgi:hypothetical protein